MIQTGQLPFEAAWPIWLQTLRERVPTKYPVKVIRRRLKDDAGLCRFNSEKRHFVITIDQGLNRRGQLDILMHEWAHALDWFTWGQTHHGPTWGVCYAKVYRELIGEE